MTKVCNFDADIKRQKNLVFLLILYSTLFILIHMQKALKHKKMKKVCLQTQKDKKRVSGVSPFKSFMHL